MKNKIIIIGCPGSGKSYFARQLRDITGLPLYYLDRIFWKENWEHLTRPELTDEITKKIATDKWIIDGNYSSTLEIRMEAAEAVYFLDIEESICIRSEAERRGTKREDLPEFLEEEEDPEFIEYIKSFKVKKGLLLWNFWKKIKTKRSIYLRLVKKSSICQKSSQGSGF